MSGTRRWIIATALVLAGAGSAVGVVAASDDDNESPITGEALDRASAAAIAYVGGGVVTDTEMGDEEGAYEVEVTIDGRQIDVHLAEDFTVLSSSQD